MEASTTPNVPVLRASTDCLPSGKGLSLGGMRTGIGILMLASTFGQETATYQSSTVDVNGRVIEGPQITTNTTQTGSVRTERVQSINGRKVPLEQVTERVIRDGAMRVVERTLQRFDQEGRPAATQITVIEQESGPAGHSMVHSTTSQRDINGNLQILERSLSVTQKTGATETSETSIERPTINGSMEPVEKRSVSKIGSADAVQETSTIYRLGANGFYQAGRVVSEKQKHAGTTTEQVAEYEIGSTGTLALHSQTARRTTKHSDGSETEIVDIFGKSGPGTIGSEGAPLTLQERESVERLIGADGSVRETLRVQRPTVSDPNVLSPPRVVSDTTCRGKCHQ